MHRLSLCLRSVLILTLLFSPFIWAQNPALEKAILAYEQRDYDKAEKLLLPLTHQGNAEANFYLGQIYRLGHLGEEDPARALPRGSGRGAWRRRGARVVAHAPRVVARSVAAR